MSGRLATLTLLLISAPAFGQVEDALFWRVTGEGINDTSYIFGTHPVVDGGFVDSLKVVESAIKRTLYYVSEVDPDSLTQHKMLRSCSHGRLHACCPVDQLTIRQH
jgi:hypothetical protein